ncbi:hypothetical protein THAOC_22976, partial [Thalassiosira oceanica]
PETLESVRPVPERTGRPTRDRSLSPRREGAAEATPGASREGGGADPFARLPVLRRRPPRPAGDPRGRAEDEDGARGRGDGVGRDRVGHVRPVVDQGMEKDGGGGPSLNSAGREGVLLPGGGRGGERARRRAPSPVPGRPPVPVPVPLTTRRPARPTPSSPAPMERAAERAVPPGRASAPSGTAVTGGGGPTPDGPLIPPGRESHERSPVT